MDEERLQEVLHLKTLFGSSGGYTEKFAVIMS